MARDRGWRDLYAHLAMLELQAGPEAAEALQLGASDLQAAAQDSDAYADETGATRAATVAYVLGAGVDGSGAVDEAAAIVDDKRPGQAYVTTADDGIEADQVAVILTVPTAYDEALETRAGGANAHLEPALTDARPNLDAAAALGLQRLMRRRR